MMLRISDRSTATWELALRPGQDERELGRGEMYAFGVDSGTAAFMDPAAAAELEALVRRSQEEGLDLAAPDASGLTRGVVACGSGYGDGAYPVWIGRDTDGEVTAFVADFGILGDRVEPVSAEGVPDAAHVAGVAVLPDAESVPAPEPFDSRPVMELVAKHIAISVQISSRSRGLDVSKLGDMSPEERRRHMQDLFN